MYVLERNQDDPEADPDPISFSSPCVFPVSATKINKSKVTN